MALYGMADNNIQIPASRDGAMYNVFAGNSDFVIKDIGDEFEITYSATSLSITLGTGEGILCGRHVTEVTESATNTSIQLDANSTGYVVIRMDLTRPAGSETFLTAVSTPRRDDLNNGGTIADLVLYEYVTAATGIARFTDVRIIQAFRESLVVHASYNNSSITADKTYAQIMDSIDHGGQPIAIYNNTVMHLVDYNSSYVTFGLAFLTEAGETRIRIFASGAVSILQYPIAPTRYFATTLGAASSTYDNTIYTGGYKLTVTATSITSSMLCNVVFPNGDYIGNVTWITGAGKVDIYFDQNPNNKAIRVEWKLPTYTSATIG